MGAAAGAGAGACCAATVVESSVTTRTYRRISTFFETHRRGKPLRDDEHTVHDFQWQRRQRARRGAVDDLRSIFWIEGRFVARTEQLLLWRQPRVDVAP